LVGVCIFKFHRGIFLSISLNFEIHGVCVQCFLLTLFVCVQCFFYVSRFVCWGLWWIFGFRWIHEMFKSSNETSTGYFGTVNASDEKWGRTPSLSNTSPSIFWQIICILFVLHLYSISILFLFYFYSICILFVFRWIHKIFKSSNETSTVYAIASCGTVYVITSCSTVYVITSCSTVYVITFCGTVYVITAFCGTVYVIIAFCGTVYVTDEKWGRTPSLFHITVYVLTPKIICIVFLLYLYCICIVIVLYLYCFFSWGVLVWGDCWDGEVCVWGLVLDVA